MMFIFKNIGYGMGFTVLVTQLLCFAVGADSGNRDSSTDSEKIQRLIEQIQQLAYCEEPLPEVESNPQAITAFYSNQREQREKSKPERLRLEAELAAFGDQAVDPIIQNLFYGEIVAETVDMLSSIGTPKAFDALKKMATGEARFRNFRTSQPRVLPIGYAAEKYVRNIKDKTGAGDLIRQYAQNESILLNTLKGLKPEDLNAELVEAIATALDKTDHGGASYFACELLAKNTNDKLRRQIADSLISILDKQSFEKGTEPTWKAGTKFVQLTLVLGRLEKAGPLLAEQAPRYKENLAMTWALTIARGMQGDRSVKPQLLDIIRNSRENLRTTAIVPLETIGTRDDIPVLQEIANTDTYCKEMRVPKRIDDKLYSNYPVQAYPVRDQATRTIEIIQKKQKK
jgi:hypothetical protein